MLTIKGIEKIYKQDVGEWRIARVETIQTAYLIQLRKSTGESMQVNLERNKIGSAYELWFWKTDNGTTWPARLMLPITQFTDIWKTIQGINLLIH
jgi:hypothetical protein